MQIAANKAVSIDYTLTNDEGEVLDSSVGGAPLVYLHGAGNIIPGLEKALEGKQSGDEIKVTVEPEEAYGDFNAELIAVLGRNMFEGVDELAVLPQPVRRERHGASLHAPASLRLGDLADDVLVHERRQKFHRLRQRCRPHEGARRPDERQASQGRLQSRVGGAVLRARAYASAAC